MIVITKVRLKNWFNYEGAYSENEIPFSDGVNFFAADNNAGKTKLHSAIRWMLKGKVILNGKEVEVTAENCEKVVSISALSRLNAGESIVSGVQVEYRKNNSRGSFSRRVSREFVVTKDRSFTIRDGKVEQRQGNAWIRCPDDFDERRAFIPGAFQRYLFLEGEQLDRLIPFSGPELTATINEMTGIQAYDEVKERGGKIERALEKVQLQLIAQGRSENEELERAVDRAKQLRESRDEFERELKQEVAKRDGLEEDIERMKKSVQGQKEVQQGIRWLEKCDVRIDMVRKRREQVERDFYHHVAKDFGISRYLSEETSFLDDEYRKLIRGIRADRVSQLDRSVDKETQRMVARLIKNEPGIEILEEIAESRVCNVCGTRDLTDSSVKYIREQLIPHFDDSKKVEDDELKLYDAVNQLVNFAIGGKAKSGRFSDRFDVLLEQVAQAESELVKLEDSKNRYIQENGDYRGAELTNSVLEDFEEMTKQLQACETQIEVLQDKASRNSKELEEVEDQLNNLGSNGGEDERKLKIIRDFHDKVVAKIEGMKEERYDAFCRELESGATRRLEKYFGQNPSVEDSRFDVGRGEGMTGDVQFSITVRNSRGVEVADPGGAETKIRQYCVVLALLEQAKKIKAQIGNFPFIVDAPISQMNQDYRLAFYKALLSEEVNSQMIILTYDLAKGGPGTGVNDDGLALLDMMKTEAAGNSGYMLYKGSSIDAVINLSEN